MLYFSRCERKHFRQKAIPFSANKRSQKPRKSLGDDLAAVSSDPTQMNGKTWKIKNEKVATELKTEHCAEQI